MTKRIVVHIHTKDSSSARVSAAINRVAESIKDLYRLSDKDGFDPEDEAKIAKLARELAHLT